MSDLNTSSLNEYALEGEYIQKTTKTLETTQLPKNNVLTTFPRKITLPFQKQADSLTQIWVSFAMGTPTIKK